MVVTPTTKTAAITAINAGNMRQLVRLTLLVSLGIVASPLVIALPRSAVVKAEFHRLNPCPADQSTRGPCPGYVIDHIIPLCAGGPDSPTNIQWQTVDDGKLKDAEERRLCSKLHPKDNHAQHA